MAGITRRRFVGRTATGIVGTALGILAGCSPAPSSVSSASSPSLGGDLLVDVTDGNLSDHDGTDLVNPVAGGDVAPQEGFVVVQDYIPAVLTDVRYYGTYNFVGERIDGYEEPLAILSVEAAEALRRASEDAQGHGYRLRLFDGYRPQRAVDHFCRWAESADESMREFFYPDIAKGDIFPQGYVARHSGHSRGSTIDLTLFDMAAGRDADMGGTFDFFGELSHPDYRGVSDGQYANRMLLRDIMAGAGFEPVSTEWWHFTLADEPYPDTYFDFPVAKASVVR